MEEVPTRIEPCFLEGTLPPTVSDLVAAIRSGASALGHGLHAETLEKVRAVVRIAEAHYSNLIEGHLCDPAEIARAVDGTELSPLAQEARAYVLGQQEIDRLHSEGRLPAPTSAEFISWVHKRLYEEMPPEFSFVDRPHGTQEPIRPGAFRTDGDSDVAVGRHQPPSSSRVAAFVDHFAKRYRQIGVEPVNKVVAMAAAHHRLNYIHPFLDGNGRVSRLVAYAMAIDAGIEGHGLWSVSRGLSRGLKDPSEYKAMMDHADHPRMGDRDGRGNLSHKALQTFCVWFLTVTKQEIVFAEEAFDIKAIGQRYRETVAATTGIEIAPDAVSAMLTTGAWDRAVIGDASLATLQRAGFLERKSAGSPLGIAFPMADVGKLFPTLFAEN